MGTRIVSTSESPVTMTEAKQHLRLDCPDDDGTLSFFIDAATEWVEEQTGQSLRVTTFETTLDAWPSDGIIKLPRLPLRSVESIRYFDATGAQQTVDSTLYVVDTSSKPGRVVLKPNREWPATDGSPLAITIEFIAGFQPDEMPKTLKQCIRFVLGHFYENREAAIDRRIDAIPLAVESILNKHKFVEAV